MVKEVVKEAGASLNERRAITRCLLVYNMHRSLVHRSICRMQTPVHRLLSVMTTSELLSLT